MSAQTVQTMILQNNYGTYRSSWLLQREGYHTVCLQSAILRKRNTDLLEFEELSQAETEVYGMFTLNIRSIHPIEVTVALDRVETTLELD